MILHDRKRRAMLHPEDPEARYELAEALFAEKQFDAAVKQVEKAIELAPDHANARRLLVRAYLADGRPVLAERALEEMVRRRPDDASARADLADLLASGGRIDDAILQLEEALRIDPDDLSRILRVADLARSRRLFDRARGHLERAIQRSPGDPIVIERLAEIAAETGRVGPDPVSPLDRGREFLAGRAREALGSAAFGDAAKTGAIREAVDRIRAGDLAGAKRALITAPEADREGAAGAFLRAEISLIEGDRDRAEKAFRRCVDRAPDLAIGWSRLAEILLARGRVDEAARACEEAARRAPDDADAAEALGDALSRAGRKEEAIAPYRRAAKIRPDPLLDAKLGEILAAIGQRGGEDRRIGRIAALGADGSGKGGSVSMLEAVAVPGRGEVIFTGNLGKNAQDSARVAYSCVKVRAASLGIEAEVEKVDLHFQFANPEATHHGGSAGLALAIVGVSALTRRPIKPNLAVTGAITLQGAVEGVSGLHEKISAAILAGIEEVIVPRQNLFALKQIPKEVVSRVGLIYVGTLGEALEHALLAREAG